MQSKPELIIDDKNLCGEGPIWDGERHVLIWNDLSSSLVFEYSPKTGHRSIISRELMAAGIALNRDGRLVLAGANGLYLWRGQNDYETILTEVKGEKLFFNDIIADARGRLYAGTTYWGASGMEKTGKLYLVRPDRSAQVAADGIQMSNGLGLSPDGRTLYYVDSSVRLIYAFDVDPESGALSRKREHVRVPDTEGLPDGLTVDAEGFIWCAQWFGSQVVRYDPQGKVERRIQIPAKQVSSVGFGGDDLRDLYVTTAADEWPSDLAPKGYPLGIGNAGGGLYRVRLDIQGRPEQRTAF